MFTASPEIVAFIREMEGTRLTSYQDIAGVWTIGTGCTGPDIGPGMTITREEADQMLADRIAEEFEPAVNRAIARSQTTQKQFDAMLSLAFNVGTGGFARSHVLVYHRQRDYQAAADAFHNWRFVHGKESRGLTRRRAREATIYRGGAYVQ